MKLKHFDLAKKLSKKSTYRFQMGAVIVKGARIFGVGFNNSKKSHPKARNEFSTTHAELSAIISAGWDNAKGSDIYIYRELKDGSPAKAAPCTHCYALLNEVGIRNIYYTDVGTYKRMKCE